METPPGPTRLRWRFLHLSTNSCTLGLRHAFIVNLPTITTNNQGVNTGFGHLLLSKYLRGYTLFIWEVVVNIQANINTAMVDSFRGKLELTKTDLHPRWMLMYIPVFIFGIWDAYRTCVDMNNVYLLAEREDAPFNTYTVGAAEINYLDKRSPVMSTIWSLFMPGLGQLHIHRILTAFFSLAWSIVFLYQSRLLEAVQLLFLGDIQASTQVLNPEWLLFMPSIWGFVVYDSYMNTVENNKLFEYEQRAFLIKNYQSHSFKMKRGKVAVHDPSHVHVRALGETRISN